MSTGVNGPHPKSNPLARSTESDGPSSKRASWASDLGQGPATLFLGQRGWQPQELEAQTVRELQAAFGDAQGRPGLGRPLRAWGPGCAQPRTAPHPGKTLLTVWCSLASRSHGCPQHTQQDSRMGLLGSLWDLIWKLSWLWEASNWKVE